MDKKLIYLCMTVGSVAGGCIPSLWDDSMFSLSGFIFTAIGGIVGIWVGFKMSES